MQLAADAIGFLTVLEMCWPSLRRKEIALWPANTAGRRAESSCLFAIVSQQDQVRMVLSCFLSLAHLQALKFFLLCYYTRLFLGFWKKIRWKSLSQREPTGSSLLNIHSIKLRLNRSSLQSSYFSFPAKLNTTNPWEKSKLLGDFHSHTWRREEGNQQNYFREWCLKPKRERSHFLLFLVSPWHLASQLKTRWCKTATNILIHWFFQSVLWVRISRQLDALSESAGTDTGV